MVGLGRQQQVGARLQIERTDQPFFVLATHDVVCQLVRLDAFFHLLVLLGIALAVVDGLADVALQLLQGLVSVLLLNQHVVA